MSVPPRIRSRGLAAGLLAAAALASMIAAGGPPVPEAGAAVPAGDPVFSDPLVIDNAFFPVQPGALKVYSGWEQRDSVTVVENHLSEVRVFSWRGADVPCRVVRDASFSEGVLRETSVRYFAQADDGSVWFFGEVSYENLGAGPDDGADDGADEEDYGWVVGAVADTDPPFTASSPDPFLFMPAVPETGDLWKPEDLFPVVDETDQVVRAGTRVRVPAGIFEGGIEVLERSAKHAGTETKWYAPGVGVVKERGKKERLRLQATTLGEPDRLRRRARR